MAEHRSLTVAVTQWHAGVEVGPNLETACSLVADAAAAGAELVVLPENGLSLGTNGEMRARALALEGPEIGRLVEVAGQAGATVVLGGFKRLVAGQDKVFNTAVVIGPAGVLGLYDKIHLFDAAVGGSVFRASDVEQAGARPLLVEVGGVGVGVTICYDVRFPELYRYLALGGAEVLLVPAAFTVTTGAAHWEVLLRARAIENGAYVVAPATVGRDGDSFPTWGHGLVVDPWGRVLVDLGTESPAWALVELDLDEVAGARTRLPVLDGVQLSVGLR